jgi:hypothetical protein
MPPAHVPDGEAPDGQVPDPGRLVDLAAIEALTVAYAYAVDDRDWTRWEALFEPDGFIDYRSAGGVCGTPAEVARWMPDALSVFTFCQHSISTHEVRFTASDQALGRVHVFNRNGVEWEGTPELVDVGAIYHDRYVRHGDRWTIHRRVEETLYVSGGAFAEVVRSMLQPVVLGDIADDDA